ncbi:hypothetical protein LCL89_09585 [Halobacillus yeomjeoni]|uniref:hypothetical protein n=1 Tax=Halobacillus yeomjeoni TaxID=311194 RepID=UPI001CD5DDBA|nr:hypothetical protein [Halobacillus yeomjeoni]MCA0984296.1 hypothetical protein [Halobacillus yeomjeoni]
MSFKTSVNIKFDFAKSELFDHYLPTPSHAEAMTALLEGINNQGQQSHIIVGPYGTGKSLIGTLIAGIASHYIKDKDYETLINKFDNVDASIYQHLIQVKENERKYLPVFLNGNEGRFREAVISGVLKALSNQNIPITIPGIVSKIISTVEMWEKDFPKTFKEFMKILSEEEKDFELWRLEILSYNSNEIEWFKKVFPRLTAGTEFVSYETEDFIGQLKYVLEKLKENNLGIIFVYDEFGRFLQSLNSESINEAMQDLQDVAELANEEESNLHTILIAHKNLRQYFSHLSTEFQQEFQRIEKRYGLYYIDNDRSTFLRLGQKIISDFKTSAPKEYVLHTKEHLRKYPLFQELNMTELERLVVKGFYPMHPVATFLLPELSKIYGQNERTLFTFLESNVSGGLKKHIGSEKDEYLPHQLFNYFFQDIENIGQYEGESEDLILFNRLIKKTTLSSKEEDLLKLLTILKLTSSYSKVKVTTEFLNFSMKSNVEQELQDLTDKKVIRYNFVQGYWEMYDGSSVNLDSAIEEQYLNVKLSKDDIENYILSLIKKKFYIPTQYNHRKSMTRFAKVNIITGDRIHNEAEGELVNDSSKSDILINFVIPTRADHSNLVEKIKEIKDEFTYFVIDDSLSLEDIVKELKLWKSCEYLLEEGSLAKEDQGVLEELDFKIAELKNNLYKQLRNYDEFSNQLQWIYKGEAFSVNSQLQLEKILTNLMESTYSETPEILNDAFNRRSISRVQKKAAIDVINAIIQTPEEDNIGIKGTGPDYLIYATVFKNNNIKVNELGKIAHPSFRNIRERLLTQISSGNESSLKDLVDILTSTPYGIREPIVPLLLIGLLRDKWDYLVFYKNDMFIAGLDGEIIYEMMEDDPEKIFVKYYDFNETYKLFFKYIENVFNEYIHESMEGKPLFLKVTSALLEWLRKLPKYTQLSEDMNKELNEFKEYIRYSEIDPDASLQFLKSKWEENEYFIEKYKEELENYLNIKSNEVKCYVYEQLSCDDFASLLKWSKEQDSFQQKTNPLVYSVLNSNDERDLVSNLSQEVIGVPLNNWSDITANAFYEQLDRHMDSLQSKVKEGTEIHYNGTFKTVKQVEMSPKTKTLYKNVHRILRNGGRTVSNDEIETLIFHLMEEFID